MLQLAEALGNVSVACRQRGMTRTQFYDDTRRFEPQGLESLKDLPPIHKSHPQTTPPAVVAQILALSLAHPAWGCVGLSERLKRDGGPVSSLTIQTLLSKHGMASKFGRLLKLEEQAATKPIELSAEQRTQREQVTPCSRERQVERSRPTPASCWPRIRAAWALSRACGRCGVDKVYPHMVVDTCGSYAFSFLHTSKVPEAAVAVLHNNDALPFYAERGLAVERVLTDNGREFCGTATLPFELYLALREIEHRRTRGRHPDQAGDVTPRPRASSNASTAPSRRRPSRSPCARPSMRPWTPSKRSWIAGLSTTTPSVPTSATATWGSARSTPSTLTRLSPRKPRSTG